MSSALRKLKISTSVCVLVLHLYWRTRLAEECALFLSYVLPAVQDEVLPPAVFLSSSVVLRCGYLNLRRRESCKVGPGSLFFRERVLLPLSARGARARWDTSHIAETEPLGGHVYVCVCHEQTGKTMDIQSEQINGHPIRLRSVRRACRCADFLVLRHLLSWSSRLR